MMYDNRDDSTFMTITEIGKNKFKVRYPIPGLGFCREIEVDYETGRLLQLAKNAGRNEHIAELKELMKTR